MGAALPASQGLSPRVRGNQAFHRRLKRLEGSIPARAGEPPSPPPVLTVREVYPRACGGTKSPWSRSRRSRGLSPRVRGNHCFQWRYGAQGRSIPARAGEPNVVCHRRQASAVYPRACGGTVPTGESLMQEVGLSPRVRGNLGVDGVVAVRDRSIPARAGEPC